MKIQNKILALVLVTAIGLSLSGRACANTALGHVTVGLAVLIDMTENPEKYAEIERATGGTLSVKDFALTKDKEGAYQVLFKQLNPVQQAFLYGCIAPDTDRIYLVLHGRNCGCHGYLHCNKRQIRVYRPS